MSELAKTDEKKKLVGLFHGKDMADQMPAPYERDIFLFDTRVAGTMYNDDIRESAAKLQAGSRLNFFREPGNVYDDLAIMIKTLDGHKIGYVPRKDNPVFARLMDAGKELFGQVKRIRDNEYYINIEIEIYLHED